MQVSDKAGDKKKCKMIGKKTIRNFASKNSIYISILMNTVHLILDHN